MFKSLFAMFAVWLSGCVPVGFHGLCMLMFLFARGICIMKNSSHSDHDAAKLKEGSKSAGDNSHPGE